MLWPLSGFVSYSLNPRPTRVEDVAEVNHFTHVAFACSSSSFLFALNPPSFLDAFLGKYLHLFHCGFQCDGARWVLLTGLSRLPYRLACSPLLFHKAPSPHPSVVGGFNPVLSCRSIKPVN